MHSTIDGDIALKGDVMMHGNEDELLLVGISAREKENSSVLIGAFL